MSLQEELVQLRKEKITGKKNVYVQTKSLPIGEECDYLVVSKKYDTALYEILISFHFDIFGCLVLSELYMFPNHFASTQHTHARARTHARTHKHTCLG